VARPRDVVFLTRRVEFCASHRLHSPALSDAENRALYGACDNPNGHGHNYVLEVTVRGPIDERTGMVIELGALRRLIEEAVVDAVDHRHLNLDVPFLEGVIPTAENLAREFWKRLEGAMGGATLQRVRVYESRDAFAEVRAPGE
jgi:6-pyruvoyltetrahydropterin/6-carboxytetrahydropterin synthase